jgi:hypothetical protein
MLAPPREGGMLKHVEDDLLDLKSERKRVERGKRLKLKRKRVEDDLVDMKSERKHVETGKRLKSECERLKSERKQLKRKDDRVPDRAYLRCARKLGVCISSILMINFVFHLIIEFVRIYVYQIIFLLCCSPIIWVSYFISISS